MSEIDSPNSTWVVCNCNTCSGRLEFDAPHAGETVTCPHCGTETVLLIPPVPVGPRKPRFLLTPKAWLLLGGVLTAGLLIGALISPSAIHGPRRTQPTAGERSATKPVNEADRPSRELTPPLVAQEPATNRPIEGLFGVKLGESLPSELIIKRRAKANMIEQGLVVLEVIPPVPNPALSHYKIKLVGDGGPVASIEGGSEVTTNTPEVERIQTGLAAELKERYGDESDCVQDQKPADGAPEFNTLHFWRSKSSRSICFAYCRFIYKGVVYARVDVSCSDLDLELKANASVKEKNLHQDKLATDTDTPHSQVRFGHRPGATDNATAAQSPSRQTEADRKKFEETKAQAMKGDAQAQRNLGHSYFNGEGVAKDVFEAVKWLRKAAQQGNAAGENGLGFCYLKGEGVAKDVFEAAKWFRKAAQQGNAAGENNLGLCYRNGEGVPKDVLEAVEWFRKAAEQGYANGQCSLGGCYDGGEGVTKDVKEAVKWFRRAADQGYANAQDCLGDCYVKGEGVPKDVLEAVKWFRKAAEQGYASAQRNLGFCYLKGEGVAKDAVEAVKWFRKAADQGFAQAQLRLGFCYLDGEGVTKDAEEAGKWVDLAAAQGEEDAKKAQALLHSLSAEQQSYSSNLESAIEFLASHIKAPMDRPELEFLNLTTKVMERNSRYWRWSYQLRVRNNTNQPIRKFQYLLFLDAEGFIIDETLCEVRVSAGETKTVAETALVSLPGAARVKTVRIK